MQQLLDEQDASFVSVASEPEAQPANGRAGKGQKAAHHGDGESLLDRLADRRPPVDHRRHLVLGLVMLVLAIGLKKLLLWLSK